MSRRFGLRVDVVLGVVLFVTVVGFLIWLPYNSVNFKPPELLMGERAQKMSDEVTAKVVELLSIDPTAKVTVTYTWYGANVTTQPSNVESGGR